VPVVLITETDTGALADAAVINIVPPADTMTLSLPTVSVADLPAPRYRVFQMIRSFSVSNLDL